MITISQSKNKKRKRNEMRGREKNKINIYMSTENRKKRIMNTSYVDFKYNDYHLYLLQKNVFKCI